MHYIVIGCGRVGAELALRLYQKGHMVAVIDQVANAFQNLKPEFRGRLVEGEALNQQVLLQAGIQETDGLAAVTNSDPLNAVVGHIARSAYLVENVIVRNYDPHWRELHEAFGLQVVGSSSWGAQRIEELLYHQELRSVFSSGNGEVELYQFTIPAGWESRRLGELFTTPNCIPVSLTRAGVASLPEENLQLQTNDILLVSADFSGSKALRQRLAQA